MDVETNTENKTVIHAIDVIYDPIPEENLAHSQIKVNPDYFGTDNK